jgi:hypothetical protein
MRYLLKVAVNLVVPLSFLVPASGASAAAPVSSGDTCSAIGNGATSYVVSVNIPSDAPAQGGFAVGASSAKVTAITSSETGTFSTASLPAQTSGAWILTTPATIGGPTALNLTTNAKVTGSFTVVPATTPATGFYSAISCGVSVAGSTPSAVFTVTRGLTYDASAHAWHLRLTVPRGGTIRAVQEIATNDVQQPTNALVLGAKLTVHRGGTYTLALKLTGDGARAFKTHSSLALKLGITFAPLVGNPASRTVRLTLTK